MRHLLLSLILVSTACGKGTSSDEGGSFASVSEIDSIVGLWKLDAITFEKLTDQISVSGLHYLQINSDGKFSEQHEAVTRSIGGNTYLDNCTMYSSGVLKIDSDTAIRQKYVGVIVSGGCHSDSGVAVLESASDAVKIEASGSTLRISLPFTFTNDAGESVADNEVMTFSRQSATSQTWEGSYDLETLTSTFVSTCGTEVVKMDVPFAGSMAITFNTPTTYTRSERNFDVSGDTCTGDEKGTVDDASPSFILMPTSYSNDCLKSEDDPTEIVKQDRTFIVNDRLVSLYASTAADTDCTDGAAAYISVGVFSKR